MDTEEWGERLWVVYNNFVDPGNQIEETAWPNRDISGTYQHFGIRFTGRCAHLYHL